MEYILSPKKKSISCIKANLAQEFWFWLMKHIEVVKYGVSEDSDGDKE